MPLTLIINTIAPQPSRRWCEKLQRRTRECRGPYPHNDPYYQPRDQDSRARRLTKLMQKVTYCVRKIRDFSLQTRAYIDKLLGMRFEILRLPNMADDQQRPVPPRPPFLGRLFGSRNRLRGGP